MVEIITLKSSRNKPIYTRNQILMGVFSAVLFITTIIYLNLWGFVAQRKNTDLFSTYPKTQTPTPKAESNDAEAVQITFPKGVILYPQENTLFAYMLTNKVNMPVATFSGQIQDLGRFNNNQIYIATGKNNDTIDEIWRQDNINYKLTKIPAVSKNIIKPSLSYDGKYLYFVTNSGSGKKSLMRLDLYNNQQQVMFESGLPLVAFYISNDNDLIALVMEMSNDNKSKKYVLGIVQAGAKNLNLFPDVELNRDTMIMFNKDKSGLIIETVNGIAQFDIKTAKVNLLGINGSLVSWLGNNKFIIAQNSYNIYACRKGLIYTNGFAKLAIVDSLTNTVEETDGNRLFQDLNSLNFPYVKPFLWQGNLDNGAISAIDTTNCNQVVIYYDSIEKVIKKVQNIDFKNKSYIYIP